jgi:hypothetical protein
MYPRFEGWLVGFRCSPSSCCRAFYQRFVIMNGEELFCRAIRLGRGQELAQAEMNRRKRGAARKREKNKAQNGLVARNLLPGVGPPPAMSPRKGGT